MRSGNLFWGIVVLFLGALLLLNNLGYLQGVNIWSLAWAIFLIALGAFVLWGGISRRPVQSEHKNVPLGGAGEARLRLQHGAGQIKLYAGGARENLLEGDFYGGVDVNTHHSGGKLEVRLRTATSLFPWGWFPGYSLDWDVQVNPGIPLILDVDSGASEAHLDLSQLRLGELHLKSGASSTKLILPAKAGFTRVEIESGVAAVKVRVPDQVAARIRWRGGLSGINVDNNRFPRVGDTYQSPDFESAENKVDMDIQMGVGSVSVF